MVTHNPELAELYANRIVTLRDGVICSDTNPFEPGFRNPASAQTQKHGQIVDVLSDGALLKF